MTRAHAAILFVSSLFSITARADVIDAGGLDAIALPVDYVIGEALLRLKTYVETGDADNASS